LKRGLPFDLIKGFDLETALIWKDERQDYKGELRFIAIGYIRERLHNLVFTPRDEALRVISLRKANTREVKKYDKFIQA